MIDHKKSCGCILFYLIYFIMFSKQFGGLVVGVLYLNNCASSPFLPIWLIANPFMLAVWGLLICVGKRELRNRIVWLIYMDVICGIVITWISAGVYLTNISRSECNDANSTQLSQNPELASISALNHTLKSANNSVMPKNINSTGNHTNRMIFRNSTVLSSSSLSSKVSSTADNINALVQNGGNVNSSADVAHSTSKEIHSGSLKNTECLKCNNTLRIYCIVIMTTAYLAPCFIYYCIPKTRKKTELELKTFFAKPGNADLIEGNNNIELTTYSKKEEIVWHTNNSLLEPTLV